jgi:hypothetical protein
MCRRWLWPAAAALLWAPLAAATGADPKDAPAGPVVEGQQLSASLDRNKVGQGERVVLTLSLRNVSDREIYVAISSPETYFDFAVIDPEGKKADLTKYGRRLFPQLYTPTAQDQPSISGAINYGYRGAMLNQPGRMVTTQLVLNAVYDMSLRGNYSVLVKRQIRSLDGKRVVQAPANPLKVSVGE